MMLYRTWMLFIWVWSHARIRTF